MSALEGLEEHPNEWTSCRLSDFVKHKSGDSKIIKGKQSSIPGVGLIQGFSASGPDVWVAAAQNFGPGVVVSAVGARCGKTFIANGEWTAIANTHVLRPGPEVDNKFLWYLTNREEWWQKSGTAQPFVKVKDSLERPIALPPLGEQEKIVEILEEQLSRLDAALASVRVVKEKSERFRRSLLHAAFSGTLTGHDSSTGDLPSGWKEEQLGEIADVGWGDLQVTKSSFIDSGFIAYSAAGPDGFREGFDFDQDGIVLSAIGAGCGRTWYAKGRWSCIKNTIRILEKSDEIKLEFLYQQLSDPNAWPKRGSGQPFISQKDARELMVKVPPLSEQAEIVQILEEQLSRLDASLAVANAIEKKASAFRRSLLHAAFSGNLTKEWREGAYV